VKELRLQGISTVDAANEFMPSFIEDYNRRLGKLPRDRHDAHRPVREDEDLDLTFSWHEPRTVTSNVALQYERKIYMLADNSERRRLIGKYIDVIQFPDGRVEIRAGGQSLPYSTYDKLGAIDQLLSLRASDSATHCGFQVWLKRNATILQRPQDGRLAMMRLSGGLLLCLILFQLWKLAGRSMCIIRVRWLAPPSAGRIESPHLAAMKWTFLTRPTKSCDGLL
jgi:hypothetical protein